MHTPNSRENLKSHCDQMRTPNSRENLKSHCDRMHTPNSRENLKSHCDQMHMPNRKENFNCHSDKMHTPNSSDIRGSRTRESGIPGETTEKVSCGLCSKSFKNESFLMIHDKCTPRFLCNICQRCFYDKRGLNLHKLVHSRKKSYRKSNRILAKMDISEYYNKDEKLTCAKSSKKYRKRVTTWRGKEKKNESTISVSKYKKTRMDVKKEKSDFKKINRKSSKRTSELNERSTPKAKESKLLLNKAIDLEKNKDGLHDGIQIGKNDIPDESLEIELIELTSDDEEKDPIMIKHKSELITEEEDDKKTFNAEPELIQIDD